MGRGSGTFERLLDRFCIRERRCGQSWSCPPRGASCWRQQ
uniref:Hepatocyte growth factor-regulated tyrosine kinase substrate n=1 Tax=Homo sapiens TaxID=9606 RepID=A0A7I2V3E9_HUMAN